ncbi:MAG: DUF167 domain-containing protein [Chitinivibrionales bacterium]
MATVTIRLKPGAKKNAIKAVSTDDISIWITSRPVEGKANAHLIKLLSKALRVAQSSCTIVRGETSRTKVVAIEGIAEGDIVEKLSGASARP